MSQLPWERPSDDCPHEHTRTTILDGSTPHYGEKRCADCGKFLGYVPKPTTKKRRTDNDTHWRRMHQERGEFVCKICGVRESDLPIQFHVHHWQPISEGGVDEFENTDMLCVFCHEALHTQRKRMSLFIERLEEVSA